MRYKIEFFPNQEIVGIHLDEMVTKKMIETFDSPVRPDYCQEEWPPLVQDLFKIRGIKRVTLTPYEINLEKGSVFEWNELVTRILNSLLTTFDPMGIAVEVSPPVHHPRPTEREIREMDRSFSEHADFLDDFLD